MAEILYHIDEIARRRNADVVWIFFEYEGLGSWEHMPTPLRRQRAEIIEWLEQKKIACEHCFGFFDGSLEEVYRGDIFVDLPIDRTNRNFAALEQMLEHPDTSPKIKGVRFLMLPLKSARKNKKLYLDIMNNI